MSLTPTIGRIPKALLIIICLLVSLTIIWGFGWFYYHLSPQLLVDVSLGAFAITLPWAAFEEWGRRREQRRKIEMIGKCPTCSYDLRAHQPGDKCPECGTVISSPPKSPV